MTSSDLKDTEKRQELINKDQAYRFLRPIRSSPAYWENCQKDLFAMLRMIGIPTFFLSFSTAEFRWPEIVNTILIQQNDIRKFDDLTWNEKAKVLKSNPVTVARMLSDRFHNFFRKVIQSEAQPIGKVKDFFLREENSDKFRPHWHAVIWIENAPQFNISGETEIISFIDRYITCSLPQEKTDPELHEIVSKVQQHSKNHTRSCRKRRSTCRFGFPRPVSTNTFIARAKNSENEDDQMQKKNAEMLVESLWKVLLNKDEEVSSTQQLLEKTNVKQCDLEEALSILSTRNTVVLKRSPKEMWTNQYNSHLLRCWNANLDIQYILDAYSCVVYIISYISKNEKTMGSLLRQTKKEAEKGNLSARLTMKRLGSTYLNKRNVSAIESVFRVCELPLKECSRNVVWIPLGENPIRISLPLNQINQDTEKIWMTNIIERYEARPCNREFESMCLAMFSSEYRVLAKSQVPKNAENCSECQITATVFRLQNELGYVQKRTRSKPAVIRYPRFMEEKEPEKHYQSILQLYLPHRSKEQLKPTTFDFYRDFYESGTVTIENDRYTVRSVVEKNRRRFEVNASEIDSAQDTIHRIDPEIGWAELCPEQEVQRLDESNVPVSTVGQDEVINSEHDFNTISSKSENKKQYVVYEKSEILPLLRTLNEKQSRIFHKVQTWCLDKIQGRNPKQFFVHITGGAGTGKSHLIKCLYYEANRLLSQISDNPDDTVVLLTGTTGNASFNIRGTTLHSAFLIPILLGKGDYIPLKEKSLNTLRAKLGSLVILIIDEVSFIKYQLFHYVSERLNQIKRTCGNEEICFGGVSVIAVGDFYQLPPVRCCDEDKLFFKTPGRNLWRKRFSIANLEEIMRQKDDANFAQMLNRFRTKAVDDTLSPNDVDTLSNCINRDVGDALLLSGRSNQVNDYNKKMLEKNCNNIFTILAQDYKTNKATGVSVRLDAPCTLKDVNTYLPHRLQIAQGCRVMLLKNIDVDDGLVNGVIGTVVELRNFENEDIEMKRVFVKFDNERVGRKRLSGLEGEMRFIEITPDEHHIGHKNVTIRKQFPLSLCYACTIHKAQGVTLEKAVVSMTHIFNPGMAYVALSRVVSLDGLSIINCSPQQFSDKIYCDQNVAKALQKMTDFIDTDDPPHDPDLRIILHNIEGLPCHFDDLKADKRVKTADCIALTETWLNASDINNFRYNLNGFEFHHAARSECFDDSNKFTKKMKNLQHGGVGLYVGDKSGFLRTGIGLSNLEHICLYNRSSDLILILLYRPPQLSEKFFTHELQEIFTAVKQEYYSNILLIGDFNQNALLNFSISSLFEANGFQQMVNFPTTQGGTLLDHVYFRGTMFVKCTRLPEYYSYHDAVAIDLSTMKI